jgi:hypothetical protein
MPWQIKSRNEEGLMKKISMLVLCGALAGFSASPVLAQNASSTSAMPAAKPAHSAKSIECSKEADAKGLHGKARKHFRSACKHGKTTM